MNEFLLNFIVVLHFVFVLFVVLTPFIGNNYFLILYSFVIPFVILHWILNNNTCALTLIEKQIRYNLYGTVPDPDECYMHRLVAPVYDFKKNNDDIEVYIYSVTTILWLISVTKLYYRWNDQPVKNLSKFIIS
jgi:hypothetical protein